MSRSGRSFAALLYGSFVATFGPTFTVLGFLVGIAAFFVIPASSTIEIRYLIVIGAIGIYLLALLFHAAFTIHRIGGGTLPATRLVSDPPAIYKTNIALLLLDESELFSHDALVSIYFLMDDVEQLIGFGRVINVQQNRKIQVLVTRSTTDQERWAELRTNNATKLRQIIVKPTVPGMALEMSANG